jgi:hypothetical protein
MEVIMFTNVGRASILLICISLWGCQGPIETPLTTISIDEAVRDVTEKVDFKGVADRLVTIEVASKNADDLRAYLTADQWRSIEEFSRVVGVDNADEFEQRFGSSFEVLFAHYASYLGCDETAAKTSANECGLECASFLVAMAGMYASVAAGPIGMIISVTSLALAAESLSRCFEAANIDACW